jgi:hypothetical protein
LGRGKKRSWAGLLRARERGCRPELACGLRKEIGREWGRWGGPQEGKGRDEREKGFSFFKFFSNSFSNFQTSIKQEIMHSNHDAQSLIISNFI